MTKSLPTQKPPYFTKLILLLSIFTAFAYNTNAQASITGDTSVCTGETQQYFVTPVAGASYVWTATGGNIVGNINTDSATINWGNAGTGTIVVAIYTNAGTIYTTMNVTIHPLPNPAITYAPYPTCPSGGADAGGSPNGGRPPCIKVCEYATVIYNTPLHAGSTYLWNVTGAQSITGQGTNSLTVTWDSTFFGTLTVIETNQWGCVDSADLCVEKVSRPVASFTTQASVCLNTVNLFTNTSTGAVTYQWYFGDGNTSTAFSPTHIYALGGTYTVTLIAYNACFCSDTFQATVTVNSLPGPDIQCPATVCAGDTQTYTTNAVGCTYQWGTIGGTILGSSTTPQVTVAWGAGAVGTLWLYTTGCAGLCSDTTFIYIPIVAATDTIAGPKKVCAGSCHTYSVTLFGGATYTWNLGVGSGGAQITQKNCNEVEICWGPFSFGTDTLTVAYYDSFLNCGGTATLLIRVRGELQVMGPPLACANTITGFGTNPFTPCTWSTTPTGPSIIGSPGASISVNWNNVPGNYLVTAVPVNPNAVCNDAAATKITVVAVPPAPDIMGDTIVCPNSTYSYCSSAGNVNWTVTGGTPSSGIGSCITVTWNNTGPYSVQAFQQLPNAPNCTSPTTTQNVYSILPLPAPSINSGATCTNNTSTLTCVTLYPAGTTYNWVIIPNNAGAITSGQGTNVINIEWGNNAGPVQVQLTVTACSQQISTTANYNLSPAPNPAINQIGLLCPGVPAQLNATGGVFTAYAWSGPLAYTSAVNPTSIIAGGLYHVTVTDNNGCTASTQYTAIPQPGPMASISTADPLSYCIGTSFIVQLNALTNPGYTFNWSNGPTINPINVTSPGTYSVTVTDANGCTALSNFITITQDSCNGGSGNPCIPNGTVSFAHPMFYGCNPLSFINTSSINASNFSWNFGDLTGANTYNATHTYIQAGFYLVTLSGLVPNTAGTDSCVLTDTAQVEVPLAPAFKYVVGCLGTPVQFTDLSAYTPGNNITSWNWSFGDATFSTMQSPPHVYASAGTYTVTLTVGNGTCNASITQVITILPLPVAAFNYPLTACVNSPVPFTDASTPIGAINQWNWDFGDAGTSLNQNPTHSYLLPITYNVQLIVRDTLGCKDTVTQSISIVSPSPVGNITAFPDTIVCAGTSVDLVAPFCIGCAYIWSNNSTNDTTTVATSGIHSVTITDPNGCAATSFIHIIVNPAPPAIIINSEDADLCLGESAYLSTISSSNYLYYWISNDTFVDGYTGSGINVLSDSIGTGVFTYQVVVTDTTTGCFDTSQVYTITVHPNPVPPVITVLGSGTICKGDTVTLIGTHPDPNVQLQWSNGETNDTIYATVGGLYILTAVDTNGCDNTASTSITVNPMPEACCFWTGCLDTCNPYTMYAPAGNTSYQWLLNDSIIPGATNVPYTATVSGSYSVIVTNSFGCTDTLGDVELNLYMCHDSICADLEIDSVGCDSSGNHVVWYHIMNTSGHTINEITFTVLQPNQNTLFGPVSVFENIPNGGMSSSHSATFYNTNAGDTLCFKAYVHEMDSIGMEMFCCNTDTECVVLPPCPEDTSTNCCYFKYDHTSINCEQSPNGYTYNISIFVDACGQLNLQLVDTGTALFANPYIVNGPTTITFNYTTPTPQSNICLIFLLYNGTVVCKDTNICIPIECDPVVQHPECDYSFKDSICVGQTNSYIYTGPTAGLTFNWNFLGGMPATATGPGPHIVTYNTAGCFIVSVTITGGTQTVTCRDSMCVVPAPVASITQSGPTLFASPGGYNYQWYSGQPLTLLPGQNNQFYNPPVGGVYCVEVISDLGCRDTACIDFNGEVGINEALIQSLQVYPSPADEWLKVNAAIQAATVVDLKLINGVGALVYERTVDASSGININIPLKQLPSGIYLLQINAGSARFTEKIFIHHR